MSSSAYGKVIYGYQFDHQLLRVADGEEFVCKSNASHVLVEGAPYCPRCGSQVLKRDRMVPSSAVVLYAKRNGLTPDGALSMLGSYQYEVPQWWQSTDEAWLFGFTVIAGGTNTCTEFMAITDCTEELGKAVRLFADLELDPMAAKYYLLVELH